MKDFTYELVVTTVIAVLAQFMAFPVAWSFTAIGCEVSPLCFAIASAASAYFVLCTAKQHYIISRHIYVLLCTMAVMILLNIASISTIFAHGMVFVAIYSVIAMPIMYHLMLLVCGSICDAEDGEVVSYRCDYDTTSEGTIYSDGLFHFTVVDGRNKIRYPISEYTKSVC